MLRVSHVLAGLSPMAKTALSSLSREIRCQTEYGGGIAAWSFNNAWRCVVDASLVGGLASWRHFTDGRYVTHINYVSIELMFRCCGLEHDGETGLVTDT